MPSEGERQPFNRPRISKEDAEKLGIRPEGEQEASPHIAGGNGGAGETQGEEAGAKEGPAEGSPTGVKSPEQVKAAKSASRGRTLAGASRRGEAYKDEKGEWVFVGEEPTKTLGGEAAEAAIGEARPSQEGEFLERARAEMERELAEWQKTRQPPPPAPGAPRPQPPPTREPVRRIRLRLSSAERIRMQTQALENELGELYGRLTQREVTTAESPEDKAIEDQLIARAKRLGLSESDLRNRIMGETGYLQMWKAKEAPQAPPAGARRRERPRPAPTPAPAPPPQAPPTAPAASPDLDLETWQQEQAQAIVEEAEAEKQRQIAGEAARKQREVNEEYRRKRQAEEKRAEEALDRWLQERKEVPPSGPRPLGAELIEGAAAAEAPPPAAPEAAPVPGAAPRDQERERWEQEQAASAAGQAEAVRHAAERSEKELGEAYLAERLTQAREAFIVAEQKWEKYLGVEGLARWFGRGRKTLARAEYERALKDYEEARAERVGADLKRFVAEQNALTDDGVRKAIEGKNVAWETITKTWKWLGDQNLEKLGWKPEGRFGRWVARSVNFRMGIGLGLMGIALASGAGTFAAIGALGARRAMAGVGATVFTAEWLKRRAEVSRTTVRYPKVKGAPLGREEAMLAEMPIHEVVALLGVMAFGLRMQGKRTAESEDYQKLMARYEALIADEYKRAGNAEEYLAKAGSNLMTSFAKAQERSKKSQDIRRGVALAAGVGAAIGVAPVLKLLYGAGEAAAIAPEVKPQQPFTEEELRELGEKLRRPGPISPQEWDEMLRRKPRSEIETMARTAGLSLDLDDVQLVQDTLGQKQMEQLALVGALEAAPGVASKFPEAFEFTIQHGEGPLHEARKAVAVYVAESGDQKLKGLTKAQRILAEGKVYRSVKPALPTSWQAGVKVSIPRSAVESALAEVSKQSPAEVRVLDKNFAPFVEKVKWSRYAVRMFDDGSIVRPWDWDEGVRHVAKATKGIGREVASYLPVGVASREAGLGAWTRLAAPSAEMVYTTGSGADEPGVVKILESSGDVSEPAPSSAAREIAERAAGEYEAALSQATERVAREVASLSPEEYRSLRELRMFEFLQKAQPSERLSKETAAVLREVRFREKLAEIIKGLPAEGREEALGLKVETFLRRYTLAQP